MGISEPYYLTVFKQAIILSLPRIMEKSQHLWTNTVILRVLIPFISSPLAIEYSQVCFVTYNQEADSVLLPSTLSSSPQIHWTIPITTN